MLIFLDFELSGFEPEDVVCSAALLAFEDGCCKRVMHTFVDEAKKISPKASMVHKITNDMLENAPKLQESQLYKYLQELNCESNTLIVHDASKIVTQAKKYNLKWYGKIIDTFRLVKHLEQECEVFSLEYLKYELRLYKKEAQCLRLCGIEDALCKKKALDDVITMQLLYEYLAQMCSEEEMHRLSFTPVLLEKFPFGKYVGYYIEEIVQSQPNYVAWMLSLEDLDEDLRYSLEYYLKG
jgi:DNA polymerase-3 subunit epsilon/exodeoxyribonuclease X